jgi:hypothetical protein
MLTTSMEGHCHLSWLWWHWICGEGLFGSRKEVVVSRRVNSAQSSFSNCKQLWIESWYFAERWLEIWRTKSFYCFFYSVFPHTYPN